jgi:hypothetical protein
MRAAHRLGAQKVDLIPLARASGGVSQRDGLGLALKRDRVFVRQTKTPLKIIEEGLFLGSRLPVRVHDAHSDLKRGRARLGG